MPRARSSRTISGAAERARPPKPASCTAARSSKYTRRYYRVVTLDPTWLFVSLFPSGVGFVLFVYGKKQQRWTLLGFGVAFMVYPYFTQSIAALIAVGAGLGVALWAAIKAGW